MKKILLTLAATAAVAAALPAAAAPYAPAHRSYGEAHAIRQINERQANLADRIKVASRRGVLRPREAGMLKYRLDQIRYTERMFKRDGLDRREIWILNQRLDALSSQVRFLIRT